MLVLGGTTEARKLCHTLAIEAGITARVSLAGATSRAENYRVPVRRGGFGGKDLLASYLVDNEIDILIDATHPFAVQISAHASYACEKTGVELVSIIRPEWPNEISWVRFNGVRAALDALPKPSIAFLAIGSKSIELVESYPEKTLYLRVIETPQKPFPNPSGGYIVARPPFDVAQEKALFEDLNITHLVVRNAGGKTGTAKLQAAEKLGIEIHMIDRPEPPTGQGPKTFSDIPSILTHLRERVAKG